MHGVIAPKFYIAAPFFNPAQLDIVQRIETMLYTYGYPYYSPRLHSGSADLSLEEKRTFSAWKPVLQSNIDEIDRCDIMLAVVEYAMPKGDHLAAVREKTSDRTGQTYIGVLKNLELPDNGVVWELGHLYHTGKPAVGFHSTKGLAEMNLMLSHTMRGLITGFHDLEEFLRGEWIDTPHGYQGKDLGRRIPKLNYDYVHSFTGDVI